MANDVTIDVAEVVKEELNAEEFSHSFTAVRSYDITAVLEDDEVLHVDVGLRETSSEIITNGAAEDTVSVDIVVRKKCNVDDIDVLDSLMNFVTEIRDYFLGNQFETENFGNVWCRSFERKPIYFYDHIREFRQFTAPLTLIFTVDVPLH